MEGIRLKEETTGRMIDCQFLLEKKRKQMWKKKREDKKEERSV